MHYRFLCFLYLVSCIFTPAGALAHGDRPSFETEDNGYLIDVGYDNIGFRPNEEIVFDFDLYTETGDTIDFASFTAIDVTVEYGGDIILTEELINEQAYIPTLPIMFTESGDYTLNVVYKQDAQELARASFPLSVAENAGAGGRIINMITYAIATLLVAIAAYAVVQSYRRRKD